MDKQQTISTLNELIETCRDGENGFRVAADHIPDPDIKTLFTTYAQQRSQFAQELQTYVERLGGTPDSSGSVAGTLHRGWINIKSTVTGENSHAILAECERGEDAAVHNYEEALKESLTSEAQSLIHRQYQEIRLAHDKVKNLERLSE